MELKEKIKGAPLAPGCYLFKDENGTIIYVGKAKVLRNRVKQYFGKANQQSDKGLLMAKLIRDVEFQITDTERDALLAEYRLIKYHRPWFNIQHKNDRFLCYSLQVSQVGKYPFFEVASSTEESKGEVLAEFRSEGRAKEVISIMNRIFKTPVCHRHLEKLTTPCLHYQLGQCLGPCGGKISPAEYDKVIHEIKKFFQVKRSGVLVRLKREMKEYVGLMEFEKAAVLKRNIDELEWLAGRLHSKIVIPADKEIILAVRAFREEGFSLFYLQQGQVTGRADFEGEVTEKGVVKLLSGGRKLNKQEEISKDCLEQISADKQMITLPVNRQIEKRTATVIHKLQEWSM